VTRYDHERSVRMVGDDGDTTDVRKYSKGWVRRRYDRDRDTATATVQLAKLIHEWHIALPGAVLGVVPAAVFWVTGAPLRETLVAYFSVFGGAYAILYPQLWCSTLADPSHGDSATGDSSHSGTSTATDTSTDDSTVTDSPTADSTATDSSTSTRLTTDDVE
jgi:hypothetical protein